MNSYIIIILAILIIPIAKILYSTKKPESLGKEEINFPYKKKDYLFTKAEQSFYEVLKFATSELSISIFAKVRLADLVYLPKNTDKRLTYWNKIQSKHIDFVICDSKLKPVLAIELNDSSHKEIPRIDRDNFVEKVLSNAKLSFIKIPAQYTYNAKDLKETIEKELQKTELTPVFHE